jgi:hypothetical protein
MTENSNLKLEWLKNELQKTNLDQHDIGKSLIKFYEECLLSANDNDLILNNFKIMINRVFDQLPLSPLTGEPDEFKETIDPEGNVVLRNKRYDPVCSELNNNTLFYDDHAVIFFINGVRTMLYQGQERSRKQINFPYYPDPEIKITEE